MRGAFGGQGRRPPWGTLGPGALSPRFKGVGWAEVLLLALAAPAWGVPPALFTADQAASGANKYAASCKLCHGKKLEGRTGPALTGPNFASAKAHFTVKDVFVFMATAMPAPQPGSLPKDDYADIMAFLLQQNGYPAGPARLTAAAAQAADVPLLYQGAPSQTAAR